MRELIHKQPAPAVGVPFARSALGQVASSPQASVFSSGQWDGSNAGPACLLGLVSGSNVFSLYKLPSARKLVTLPARLRPGSCLALGKRLLNRLGMWLVDISDHLRVLRGLP